VLSAALCSVRHMQGLELPGFIVVMNRQLVEFRRKCYIVLNSGL
jgi:hypothetical protein